MRSTGSNRWWGVAALAGLAAACGGDGAGAAAGADAGLRDAAGGQADAGVRDAGGAADAGVPPDRPVRFVVMGDTGEGNQAQADVAAAIAATCAARGCDFVVLLGDNIYDSGVDSVDDPQWQTKFEQPYRDIDLPFYVVLGNHDYGGSLFGFDQGGLGNEWDKGPIEVMYSDVSDKWEMPATHYTFTWGNVGFIMLDTNSILWDDTTHGDQREWYAAALAEVAGADWVFAAGHHPYLSNGRHGNAGNYESIEVGGVEIPNPLPVLNGDHVKAFFDDVVCGTVAVYFAGHDHNRQWLDAPSALCGAELIVSGAGAKTTPFSDPAPNAAHWQDDSTEGFLYVVVDRNTFTGQFIDRTGAVNFERTITR
ncbi:MAG: hypothetical protein D6689_03070 [Deltaproteobacteria bacterium]|nr:MAG: hypothetical protein D6689_03070 [Deltaproteobacteria bacterium]